MFAVAVLLAASRSGFAASATSDDRVKSRKTARRAREATSRQLTRKDLFRDSWRLDRKLSATDRISDAKLTGQEYLPGQMRKERKELKEEEETSRRLAAREQSRKARAARQQQAEKARAIEARRKKRTRVF